jgi:hypothetical protein
LSVNFREWTGPSTLTSEPFFRFFADIRRGFPRQPPDATRYAPELPGPGRSNAPW